MYKPVVILLLASVAVGFPQGKSEDLDAIISSIFNSDAGKDNRTTGTTTSDPFTSTTGEFCSVNERAGVCTRYYECGKVVNANDGTIDINGSEQPCESYLDVCCDKDSASAKE